MESSNIAIDFNSVAVWDKLYKRGLFDTIRYPDGMVYEDVATTHRLLYSANYIAVIPDYLYCHVRRSGSITKSPSFESRKGFFITSCLHYDFLLRNKLSVEGFNQAFLSPSIEVISTGYPCNGFVYKTARAIVDSTKEIPRELSWKKRRVDVMEMEQASVLFDL